jgi:hypothetical protein
MMSRLWARSSFGHEWVCRQEVEAVGWAHGHAWIRGLLAYVSAITLCGRYALGGWNRCEFLLLLLLLPIVACGSLLNDSRQPFSSDVALISMMNDTLPALTEFIHTLLLIYPGAVGHDRMG